MIYDDVKQQYFEARKSKSKWASTYSFLVSEMDSIAKKKMQDGVSDADAAAVITKFFNNVTISLDSAKNAGADWKRYEEEIMEFKKFVPQQMSKSELEEIIFNRIVEGFDMKSIMSHLKENHAGKYDAKVASQIVKENLK